ncbi:MAG: DEAD/DEAH box helicase, partial [Nostoc sp.]
EALRDNGIAATFLNSSLNGHQTRSREEAIVNGKVKLLYVAPERLLSDRFLPFLDLIHHQVGISAFAIDEAHCVSQWGHDFRPAYLSVRHAIRALGRPPVLALTATATPHIIEDVVKQLAMVDP